MGFFLGNGHFGRKSFGGSFRNTVQSLIVLDSNTLMHCSTNQWLDDNPSQRQKLTFSSLMKTNDAWVPSNHPTIVTIFIIIISIFDEVRNNDDHDHVDGNQPAS